MEDISDLLLDNIVNADILPHDKRHLVKDAIMKKHTHQFEKSKKTKSAENFLKKSFTEAGGLASKGSSK